MDLGRSIGEHLIPMSGQISDMESEQEAADLSLIQRDRSVAPHVYALWKPEVPLTKPIRGQCSCASHRFPRFLEMVGHQAKLGISRGGESRRRVRPSHPCRALRIPQRLSNRPSPLLRVWKEDSARPREPPNNACEAYPENPVGRKGAAPS